MYFEPPSGVNVVRIDPETNALAGPSCPDTIEEVFITGTAPTTYCPIHGFRLSGTVEEAGSAIGKAVKGIGRFFGGLFGKEKDNVPAKQQQ